MLRGQTDTKMRSIRNKTKWLWMNSSNSRKTTNSAWFRRWMTLLNREIYFPGFLWMRSTPIFVQILLRRIGNSIIRVFLSVTFLNCLLRRRGFISTVTNRIQGIDSSVKPSCFVTGHSCKRLIRSPELLKSWIYPTGSNLIIRILRSFQTSEKFLKFEA